jgi:hypothetical protein
MGECSRFRVASKGRSRHSRFHAFLWVKVMLGVPMCRRIERSAIRTSKPGCGVDGAEWNAFKVTTVATVAQGKCIVEQERWMGGWNGMECNSIGKVSPHLNMSESSINPAEKPSMGFLTRSAVQSARGGVMRCDAMRCDGCERRMSERVLIW